MRQTDYDRDYERRLGVPIRSSREEREIARKRYRWDFDNQLWYRDIDRDRATAALRDRQRAKVQKRIDRDAMFLPKADLDVNGLPLVGYDNG